ncbi:MAG: protein translocase subunit SecD [Chloroflexia bacterium]
MRQNNLFAWLIGIVILTMVAGYFSLVDNIPLINKDIRPRLGLDLQGGLQLVMQANPTGNSPITPADLEAARNILEDRANGTGAAEPIVQTAEGNRILVELPGISNLEDARRIIQETAFLEIVDGGSAPPREGEFVCTTLGKPRPEQLSALAAPTAVAVPTVSASGTVTGTIPTATAVPSTPTAGATTAPGEFQCGTTYTTIIQGNQINGGGVQVVFDSAGRPQVAFALQGDGSSKFADFTASHIGQYMPILLDKKVISAPIIQGAITGGSGVINNIARADAQKLAIQLKYGALPVSLSLQSERKISATLGQDAIDKSILAGIIGLGLVILFMITYYRLPGVLASVALVIYSLVTYAIFKLVPVTLTLAGIAGFILSIGMAVDANVLIFSRLKEELRSGKTLGAAVEAGFDHAWLSIRDSNTSTLITCAILFWFGSTFGGASIIKGFALTLAIGVAVSLFSAITVTRTFLRLVVQTSLAQSRWAFDLETAKPAPERTTEA